MPDRPLHPDTGPDGMWDPNRPPSRGQMASLAVLACRLLGIDEPSSREEASVAITRVRLALNDEEVQRAVADASPF